MALLLSLLPLLMLLLLLPQLLSPLLMLLSPLLSLLLLLLLLLLLPPLLLLPLGMRVMLTLLPFTPHSPPQRSRPPQYVPKTARWCSVRGSPPF